jgi:hypothetical protein
MALPKHAEAREMLQAYRTATTPQAKQEVIKPMRKRGFSEVATRFQNLLADEQEGKR